MNYRREDTIDSLNKLTIKETAVMVFDLTCSPKNMNLIDAYTYIYDRYNIDYSYEEIKEFLFHHDMMKLKEN